MRRPILARLALMALLANGCGSKGGTQGSQAGERHVAPIEDERYLFLRHGYSWRRSEDRESTVDEIASRLPYERIRIEFLGPTRKLLDFRAKGGSRRENGAERSQRKDEDLLGFGLLCLGMEQLGFEAMCAESTGSADEPVDLIVEAWSWEDADPTAFRGHWQSAPADMRCVARLAEGLEQSTRWDRAVEEAR